MWDSTHRGCCSLLLSIPWGTQGTTRRKHANNDACEIDDYIGCEGISQSKNNFYDVIRLEIIESRYFPKETVKVGLEKSNQSGGQVKAMKCRWISSAEISNLDVDRDFFR